MTVRKPVDSPTGELAQALSVLNARIEPVPLVGAGGGPSQVLVDLGPLLKSVHLIQLKHTTLLCLEFAQALQPVGVKLLDYARPVPLLASAGIHAPHSFACSGTVVFAQWPSLQVNDMQPITVGLLGLPTPYAVRNVPVQRFSKDTLITLQHYFAVGAAAMPALIGGHSANAIELRSLLKTLTQVQAQTTNLFVGKADGVIGGVVEGWVWNPSQPKKRFEIQAWLGDRLVGYGQANLWREDLEKAKKDDGRVKFEVRIANFLNDGQVHAIQIKIVDPDTHQAIKNLGEPLKYQHLNKSFAFALKPEIMGYDVDVRMVKLLLKRANLGNQALAIEAACRKISMHLEDLDFNAARQGLERLFQMGFDNGFSRTKLAESYVVEGDYAQAAAFYRQVIAKAKDFVWAHIGLGYVCERLFEKNDAIAAYQQALALSPNLKKIAERIDVLRSELNLNEPDAELAPATLEGLIKHTQRSLLVNPSDYALSEKIHTFEQQLKQLGGAHATETPRNTVESLALRRLRHARIFLQSCVSHAK